MKHVRGTVGQVLWQAAPPEIKVRVRVHEGRLMETTMVAEHAIRDATWFLYGKRTGPGYPVRLEPAKELTADFPEGAIQAVETRVTLVPRGATPDAIARNLAVAAKRAMRSLAKSGVVLVTDLAGAVA